MSPDKKALALAATIVSLWRTWEDGNEDMQDDALRLAFEAVRTIDLHHVEGVIASPLNYFAMAYLDEHNPEDLTYSEMVESLAISIRLMKGESV